MMELDDDIVERLRLNLISNKLFNSSASLIVLIIKKLQQIGGAANEFFFPSFPLNFLLCIYRVCFST